MIITYLQMLQLIFVSADGLILTSEYFRDELPVNEEYFFSLFALFCHFYDFVVFTLSLQICLHWVLWLFVLQNVVLQTL